MPYQLPGISSPPSKLHGSIPKHFVKRNIHGTNLNCLQHITQHEVTDLIQMMSTPWTVFISNKTGETCPTYVVSVSLLSVCPCSVGSRRLITSRDTITTDNLCIHGQRRRRCHDSEHIHMCEGLCGQVDMGLSCQIL